MSADVSIRQPELAEVALQHAEQTSAYVSIASTRQHTSAQVSIRQHVSIHQKVAEVALGMRSISEAIVKHQ